MRFWFRDSEQPRNDDSMSRAWVRTQLSEAALELHTLAVLASMTEDCVGFITDEYLDSQTMDTTTAAFELETSGLWERDMAGYRVERDQLLDIVDVIDGQLTLFAEACESRGGHVTSPDHPGFCVRCLSPFS